MITIYCRLVGEDGSFSRVVKRRVRVWPGKHVFAFRARGRCKPVAVEHCTPSLGVGWRRLPARAGYGDGWMQAGDTFQVSIELNINWSE